MAINLSPEAPIHAVADPSVVGDLYEIVPALVTAIQDARDASRDGVAGAGNRAPSEAARAE